MIEKMNQAAGGVREWSGAGNQANDINLFMSGGFLAVSDLGWTPPRDPLSTRVGQLRACSGN